MASGQEDLLVWPCERLAPGSSETLLRSKEEEKDKVSFTRLPLNSNTQHVVMELNAWKRMESQAEGGTRVRVWEPLAPNVTNGKKKEAKEENIVLGWCFCLFVCSVFWFC